MELKNTSLSILFFYWVSKEIYSIIIVNMLQFFSLFADKRHTTLSGTPGGGSVRFLGGGLFWNDLLSNRHSPIFP
jgi:hypothetical protein